MRPHTDTTRQPHTGTLGCGRKSSGTPAPRGRTNAYTSGLHRGDELRDGRLEPVEETRRRHWRLTAPLCHLSDDSCDAGDREVEGWPGPFARPHFCIRSSGFESPISRSTLRHWSIAPLMHSGQIGRVCLARVAAHVGKSALRASASLARISARVVSSASTTASNPLLPSTMRRGGGS